jgi:hypothetical protein
VCGISLEHKNVLLKHIRQVMSDDILIFLLLLCQANLLFVIQLHRALYLSYNGGSVHLGRTMGVVYGT